MFEFYLLVITGLGLGPQAVKGIVGGRPAGNEHFYHAILKKNGEFFCNGALISQQHVLTAATCIELGDIFLRTSQTRQVTATVGTINVDGDDGRSYLINEEKTFTSMGTDKVEASPDIQYNLGIYTLQEIVRTSIAKHVSIQSPRTEYAYGKSATVTAVGPTYTEGPRSSQVLQLEVKVIKPDRCQKNVACHNIYIGPYHICGLAKEEDTGITHGDNGGLLVHNKFLIGIVAIVPIPGAQGLPDVYINVRYYKPWIVYITHNT